MNGDSMKVIEMTELDNRIGLIKDDCEDEELGRFSSDIPNAKNSRSFVIAMEDDDDDDQHTDPAETPDKLDLINPSVPDPPLMSNILSRGNSQSEFDRELGTKSEFMEVKLSDQQLSKSTKETLSNAARPQESTNPLSMLVRSFSSDKGEMVSQRELDTSRELIEKVSVKREAGEEEAEEVVLGFYSAIVLLSVVTVLIAILSEIISATIETACASLHLSSVFVATIILPIVGNAAEHSSAIVFAMKNKVNLSLSIAIGSSTQIALCVLPFTVLLAWCSRLDMSLEFGLYESACILLSVFSVTIALKDGVTNWLIGLSLVAAYVIIAIGFYEHDSVPLDAVEGR
jgi:Ca2+/Na+ antiporter